MAWYSGDDHDSTDSADEATVGLIEPKPESTTRHPTKWRHSCVTQSFLGVLLVFSNVAWAGFCFILWQKLHIPPGSALASHDDFDTNFGT
jgi:hypothetical protein